MDELKLKISPLTAAAIVCLGIASYFFNPTPAQIGVVTGAALGGVAVSAIVSNPIGVLVGVAAGSVAGYKVGNRAE